MECRAVPAWWTVTAPSPAAGTLGSTSATHVGDLEFRPEYTPVSGSVTVWADTAAGAAANALTGLITVTAGPDVVDQLFTPDSIGISTSEQKPFLLTVSGTTVGIAFEDMAGQPGSDYDYNDRTWAGVTVVGASDPVIDAGLWTWTAPKTGETATVAMKVTVESPGVYFWKYDLTNVNSSVAYPNIPELEWFRLFGGATPADAGAYDIATTMAGWVQLAGEFGWGGGFGVGPWLTISSTASFTFRTPPVPVLSGTGSSQMGPVALDPDFPDFLGYLTGTLLTGLVKAPGKEFEAKLESVEFVGPPDNGINKGLNFNVLADPGDGSKPFDHTNGEWNDTNWNGAIDKTGEHQVPVGYVRSHDAMVEGNKVFVESSIRTSARFKVTKAGEGNEEILVKADGPGIYSLAPKSATVIGGYVVLPESKFAKPLADKVDHFRTFDLKWSISIDGGTTWIAAGTSKNEMFVTLAIPEAGVSMYVTPVWLFASGAKGARTQDGAIRGAFTPFESKEVSTHPDVDLVRNDPKELLYYYRNWSFSQGNINTNSLLQWKDGQCQAWVGLFLDT